MKNKDLNKLAVTSPQIRTDRLTGTSLPRVPFFLQKCVPQAAVALRQGERRRLVPGGDSGRGLGAGGQESLSDRPDPNGKGQTQSPERSHVPQLRARTRGHHHRHPQPR